MKFLVIALVIVSSYSCQNKKTGGFFTREDFLSANKASSVAHFYDFLAEHDLASSNGEESSGARKNHQDVFKQLPLDELDKFNQNKQLQGLVTLTKMLSLYFKKSEKYKDLLKDLESKNVDFAQAEYLESIKNYFVKSGHYEKKYYLHILGKFSNSPGINYFYYQSSLTEMFKDGKISKKQLMNLGDNIIVNTSKDKYMGFDVITKSAGHFIKMIPFVDNCSGECKNIRREVASIQKNHKDKIKLLDNDYNKIYSFLDKEFDLSKMSDSEFDLKYHKSREFREKYNSLVAPVWWN